MSSSLQQQHRHQTQSSTKARIHIGHFGFQVPEWERKAELESNSARVLSDLNLRQTPMALADCHSSGALLRVQGLLRWVSMYPFLAEHVAGDGPILDLSSET
jgi:hypothetical protein